MKKVSIDLDTWELTWALNFEGITKVEESFIQKIWIIAQELICDLKGDNISDMDKVSILFISKSLRLLRSIYILNGQGYWPEAEILHRTLFETQICLFYIHDDKKGTRASKWLKMEKVNQRWPVKDFLESFANGLKSNKYGNLSFMSHLDLLDPDISF